jgi:lipoic acid synthetase
VILLVYELGLVEYEAACDLQEAVAAARAEGSVGDSLLLVQHPPVITVGRGGGWHDILGPAKALQRAGVRVLATDRGGRATYHGPGQLVAYPILKLPDEDLHAYLWRLEEAVIQALAGYGLAAGRLKAHPGVWLDGQKIAAVGLAVRQGVTRHGIALNVAPQMAHFDLLVPCGLVEHGVTSMADALGSAPDLGEVGRAFALAFGRLSGCEVAWVDAGTLDRFVIARLSMADACHSESESMSSRGASVVCEGQSDPHLSQRWGLLRRQGQASRNDRFPSRSEHASRQRRGYPHLSQRPTDERGDVACARDERARAPVGVQPRWLWCPVSPQAEAAVARMTGLLDGLSLHTVCQEARCPNLAECFGQGTATFLLLGDRCTRGCHFCAVGHGAPAPPDPEEPQRVAEAAARLGLRHVVLTSVTRDDLPDGGAGHFAACLDALRRRLPRARVEVLIPDLRGSHTALEVVLQARPDVLNHNVETVPRLYRAVRPGADYGRSLALLARAKVQCPGLLTKSGLMLGLGERTAEVVQVLYDLRRAGCDLLTLGQYLQPSEEQLPVARYVPPEEFLAYGDKAREMGFRGVASGPLVRSSHQAEALWAAAHAPGDLRVPREARVGSGRAEAPSKLGDPLLGAVRGRQQ